MSEILDLNNCGCTSSGSGAGSNTNVSVSCDDSNTLPTYFCKDDLIYKLSNEGTHYVNQDDPDDTIIYEDLISGGYNVCDFSSGGGVPLAFISSVNPSRLADSVAVDIIIKGSYFEAASTLSVEDATVNSFTVIDGNTINANITPGAGLGDKDVTVSNSTGSTIVSGLLVVADSTWYDLRTGGDSFTIGTGSGNDIRYGGNVTGVLRDADGLYTTRSSNSWYNWVKFEFLNWQRGDNKKFEFIFKIWDSGAFMLGITSANNDESLTAPGFAYGQAELVSYFTNPDTHWGLYGNDSEPGNDINYNSSSSLSGVTTDYYKIIITRDGSRDGDLTIYKLPSGAPSDWDDVGTRTRIYNVDLTFISPIQDFLLPVMIPNSSINERIVAMRLI